MSNEFVMLACSKFFLGYARPCLTRIREANIAKVIQLQVLLSLYLLKMFFVRGIFKELVSAENTSAGGSYVVVGLTSIRSWLSRK